MKIKDCKLEELPTCDVADNISSFASHFKGLEDGHVVVLEEEIPVGIICSHDIVSKVYAANKDIKSTKAEQVMSSPVFVLHDDEDIKLACAAIIKKGLSACPVINKDKKCVGTISLIELLKKINKNGS